MEYRVLTCVYCGHEYPVGTPASGADILTEHIRQCGKHPLKKANDEIAKLHGVLAEVSSLAHAGGNMGFDIQLDCLTEIRKLTLGW